jgi:hypothetical protein
MGRRASLATAAGLAGGVLLGLIVWSQQTRRFRRDLFSRRPLRRLAALGYLRGQRSAETVRLLRDYVGWETRPRLRSRGEKILRRMEQALE